MRRTAIVAVLAVVLGIACLWVGRADAGPLDYPPSTYPTSTHPSYPTTAPTYPTTHPTYPTTHPTYPSTSSSAPPTTAGSTTTMASTTVPVTNPVTVPTIPTTPSPTTAPPEPTSVVPKKVWVCKYVRTPGGDEVLQTGQNPISVSVNAIPNPPGPNVQIGDEFADAQGRSIVVGFDNGGPPPDITTLCPEHHGSTTTTAGSTTTTGGSTTTTNGSTTSSSTPPTGQFALNVLAVCPSGTTPLISITFPNLPELNGMSGPLTFSTGGSIDLTFIANATVQVPYPASAGTGPVTLTYSVGGEDATPVTLDFPENCTPGTTTAPGSTTTTPPGGTTTTTLAGSTTTIALVEGLDIGSAASVCSRDVPLVNLTFGNQPEFNGIVGTIQFVSLDGTLNEIHDVTYQANTTVTLLYPGASIDPVTGEATDWPGWLLNSDGFWVLDPSDQAYREGIRVIATLPVTGEAGLPSGFGQSRPILQQVDSGTVTAETTITYPPETAACNSPEGPFTPGEETPRSPIPGGPGGSIPPTGSDALPLVLGGTLILGGGGGLIWLTRRRVRLG